MQKALQHLIKCTERPKVLECYERLEEIGWVRPFRSSIIGYFLYLWCFLYFRSVHTNIREIWMTLPQIFLLRGIKRILDVDGYNFRETLFGFFCNHRLGFFLCWYMVINIVWFFCMLVAYVKNIIWFVP